MVFQALVYRESMRKGGQSYSKVHLGTRLMVANQTGRLLDLGCAGSDEAKETWASFETTDFVPMAIRKCYSQSCPHAIHCILCLSANSLEAGWIQIQHGLGVLGSYDANMAKEENTEVTNSREKRCISHSVRPSCTGGNKPTPQGLNHQ